MAPLLRFQTVGRGFARSVVERHSPQAGSVVDGLVESDVVSFVPTPVSLGGRDIPDTPSGVPVVDTPSLTASTKALAGLIVFLGIVIIGVSGLRLRKFIRSRSPKVAKSRHLKSLSLCQSPFPEKIISERRNPLYTQTLIDFGYDGLQPPSKARTEPKKLCWESESEAQFATWVPQIRSWSENARDASRPDLLPRPFLLPPPPEPVAVKLSRFSRLAAVFSRSPKPSEASFDIDAAPPYTCAAPTPRRWGSSVNPSSLAPTPDSGRSLSEVSGGSPARMKMQKASRNLPPIIVTASNMKIPRVPVPTFVVSPVQAVNDTYMTQTVDVEPHATADANTLKSPTRADSANLVGSFSPVVLGDDLRVPESLGRASPESKHTSLRANLTGITQESQDKGVISGNRVPRLVTVVEVFSPKLEDEFRVQLGEVLRLTCEFHDGWCAVERLEKDDKRGVVPLFCVAARTSVVDGADRRSRLRLVFTGSASNAQL